jgi:hypothetical protein
MLESTKSWVPARHTNAEILKLCSIKVNFYNAEINIIVAELQTKLCTLYLFLTNITKQSTLGASSSLQRAH